MLTIGRHVSRLSGFAPALPTPFTERGTVDRAAFAQLCTLQIKAGATALVPCGTTGEAATLTAVEQRELVEIAVDIARGRVPVIAGAGSNATARAIELSRQAQAAGANAVLSVVPYYNKPTQEGLYRHFMAIAQSVDLPVILYDVPSRTGCSLADQTIARLAEHPRIIGLKDATGDVARPSRLRRLVGPKFRLLSGDDATAALFIRHGGDGCISVTSNVIPGLCRTLFLACRHDQQRRLEHVSESVLQLTTALFRETNPVPVKFALSALGLMAPTVRLPLVAPSLPVQAEVMRALTRLSADHPDHMIGALAADRHAVA